MFISDEIELGDTVSGVVVLGLEHCSPQGKIENHNQTFTEEDGGTFTGTHNCEVQNSAILEFARNLQFSLHRVIHHVHVW